MAVMHMRVDDLQGASRSWDRSGGTGHRTSDIAPEFPTGERRHEYVELCLLPLPLERLMCNAGRAGRSRRTIFLIWHEGELRPPPLSPTLRFAALRVTRKGRGSKKPLPDSKFLLDIKRLEGGGRVGVNGQSGPEK
ncbi:hypothetical protein GCM10025871_06470 [Deinococcus metallilatus]|nr:hypothetical protein GCM10025871_06470 [Deinococcus metallilatus]